jgi:hypothetical protein
MFYLPPPNSAVRLTSSSEPCPTVINMPTPWIPKAVYTEDTVELDIRAELEFWLTFTGGKGSV